MVLCCEEFTGGEDDNVVEGEKMRIIRMRGFFFFFSFSSKKKEGRSTTSAKLSTLHSTQFHSKCKQQLQDFGFKVGSFGPHLRIQELRGSGSIKRLVE